jgi:uncharacterized iron-regulated protein
MRNLIHLVGKGAAQLPGAFLAAALAVAPAVARAEAGPVSLSESILQPMQGADVVILGEVHDNPHHHLAQAAALAALQPKAVVWEMLTAGQAAALAGQDLGDADAVRAQLQWDSSGWPDFRLYAPVFAAADGARQFGGLVPRSAVGPAMEQGVAAYFGQRSAAFGLDQPLPAAQQAQREADQLSNHCNAMPAEMLPMLVDFQRLRDATLAAAVLQALDETGGPGAVITGNGHARKDRGVPVYLAKARPGLMLQVLGQSEAGRIEGDYDLLLDAAAEERPDPCLAFSKG